MPGNADEQAVQTLVPTLTTDPRTAYLLNESAVKALGWTPDQAIGRTLYRNFKKGVVTGVLKDFHFAPLQRGISPLVIFLDGKTFPHIFQAYVNVSGRDIPGTLKALETVWRERVPHRPFQYHFLEDNYNVLYHSEQQTARIFSTFVTLLSTDFLKLVALASLIAFPVAWVSMSRWLDGFAYRITVDGWIFLLAGLAAALVALLTIGLQVVKAANANPIKSLKSA